MRVKGVIFDLDGTLIDSFPAIREVFLKTLVEMNLPTEQLFKLNDVYGNAITEMISNIIPESHLQEDIVKQFMGIAFKKYTPQLWEEKIRVFPNIHKLLGFLKKEDILLGIVTNSTQKDADRINRMFFSDMFDYVWGDQGNGKEKPNPEGINQIISTWGYDKSQILYVGDTMVDSRTAEVAGIQMVWADWSGCNIDYLKNDIRDVLIMKNPLDLVRLIQ